MNMSEKTEKNEWVISRLLSKYINKIEIIGHKKSLFIEIRLYAVGQDQYTELFNALSKLDLDNLAQMALFAQQKLSAMGIDDSKMEQISKNANKQ